MNNNTLTLALEAAFDQYDAAQAEHIAALKNDSRPDLVRHAFERSRTYEELKKELKAALEQMNESGVAMLPETIACRDRIALTLDKNRELTGLMIAYRDQVEQRLKRIRQGKTALNGYGGHATANRKKMGGSFG